MSNVIEFFEQMGRDSRLRSATGPELEAALIGAGIEPNVRAAILAGDQERLESLIGASHNICNMINVPEEEEESEEEGGEDKEDEEHEGNDDGAEEE
jgi:hypothetical protein